jgi:phage regulator Rha-like protein
LLVNGVNDNTYQKIGDFKVEFIGEFESICKKALTRILGTQMELFYEKKTRDKKSRVTVPLNSSLAVS